MVLGAHGLDQKKKKDWTTAGDRGGNNGNM